MGGSIISAFIALIDFGKVFIFVYSSSHHKCVKLSDMINCTAAEEILHGNKVTLTQLIFGIKKTVLVSFGQQM